MWRLCGEMASIFLRLSHTGLYSDGRANANPVLINDLPTGLGHQHYKVPVYVPVGGSIDIPASSQSLLSFEQGVIDQHITAGTITGTLYQQPDVFSNATRPAASTYPQGVMIWNTDDDAPQFSDGAGNWRDAAGNIT